MDITIVTDEAYISYAGCGLAYYVGGVVGDRDRLFARSPDEFREKQRIEVFLRHRVESIDTYDHEVRGSRLDTGEPFACSWDKLLIATGSSPIIPQVDGVDLDGIFPLHSIPHAESIRAWLAGRDIRSAAVLGAGYIGVELAEMMVKLGIPVTVLEQRDRVAPGILGPELSDMVRERMEANGVRLVTGAAVDRFLADERGAVRGLVAAGNEYLCDIAFLAAGVRPNVELARGARIAIGPTGAIRIDDRMETSVRGVYAAGDCAETVHIVTGAPFMLPLGSTANKMGRVAGANIAGGSRRFPGVLGTAIVKVFDLAVARTGLTEEEARDAGFFTESATVTVPARPGYYPGGGEIHLLVVADRKTRRVIGAQAVGDASVDKVIDTVATAITGRLTVDDCTNLDISYSPPFATALGAINVAAQVLQGKLE